MTPSPITKLTVAAIGGLALVATACTSIDSVQTTSTTTTGTVAESTTTTTVPAATNPTATTSTVADDTTTTVAPSAGPSAADIVLPAVLAVTPSQGEGPYYPVTKPEDRDNNLLVVSGSTEIPIGTPLEISGLLVGEDATPVVGATIEIWQVDGQGIYDHPNAPNTEDRDQRFQFYGEAVTDADGFWTFLTLDTVLYESRPRHIHAKVIVNGSEALTTQIYFEGDPLLAGDGLAAGAGDSIDLLTTLAVPGTLSNGLEGLIATHVIVLAGRPPAGG